MHAMDLSTIANRMSIHQRLTLLSTSTFQFSASLYNINKAMHALYPLTLSSHTTISETLDIQMLQFFTHGFFP